MNFYFITNISLSAICGFLLFIFYTSLFFNNDCIFKFMDFEDYLEDNIDNDSKKDEKQKNRNDKKIIPYEKKYNDKFNKMLLLKERHFVSMEENKDDEKLTKCILFENTSLGNVIMFYKYYEDTKDASSFHYYADHNIPYRFLESIAQKYCIIYNCTHIFINMSDELRSIKQMERSMEITKENQNNQQHFGEDLRSIKEKKIIQTKQVFANFKSYNSTLNTISSSNPINKNSNNISNYNNERIIQNISTKYNNKKIQNNNELKFYKERNNRYTYLGKLCNFSFIQKNNINYKINENISYKDFKKFE
jgi:hypothetical protein